MLLNLYLSLIDKSSGDTSDIISDSSGVGTNSTDSAVCSIGRPSTTAVCMEDYSNTLSDHLNVQSSEAIESNNTSHSEFFKSHCDQEVQYRQKRPFNARNNRPDLLLSIESQRPKNMAPEMEEIMNLVENENTQFNSSTGPRIKKR